MTASINIATFLSLVMIALWFRFLHRTWTTPSAAFSGYWVIMMGVGFLGAGWGQVPTIGPLTIVLFVCAYSLGAAVPVGPRPRAEKKTGQVFNVGLLSKFVLVATILGMTAVPLHAILDQGGVSFSLIGLREFAQEASLTRYLDKKATPALVRGVLVALYVAAATGGILGAASEASRKGWARRISYLSLMPGGVYAMGTTTKATLVWVLLLWFAGYITHQLCMGKNPGSQLTSSSAKKLRLIALGVLVATALSATYYLRYGFSNELDVGNIAPYIQKYATAHLRNYSLWANEVSAHHVSELTFGTSSFAGIASFLGITTRKLGLYDTTAFQGGESLGNIYTAFRGLSQDFGVLGGALLCLTGGLFSRYVYECVKKQVALAFSVPSMTAIYLVIGWSFVVNPLGYTTLMASMFGTALVVKVTLNGGGNLTPRRPR